MRTPKDRRLANGEVVWFVRYRRNGKQRTLTLHGPDARRDADEFAKLLDSIGADKAVAWWNSQTAAADQAAGITLDEWAARYIARLTRITDGTRVGYTRLYDRVWKPRLGRFPLTLIDEEVVARAVNDYSATKSDKTVANAHGLLAGMMKAAVRAGHIEASPCEHIALPRRTEHEATEMRFLDHGEWARLYDALPGHYRPLFLFLVGTGARWGEAEALTVGDVDLEAALVRISKAIKWDSSKSVRDVGPTKTRKSRRTVTLPGELVDVLRPVVAGRPRSDRLFLATRGGQLRHRTVYRDWKRATAKAGLDPAPRIHDLRHTHASWLIAAGVPLPVIQARLGHESITTTVDRYGHLLPDLQLAAAKAANMALQMPLAIER